MRTKTLFLFTSEAFKKQRAGTASQLPVFARDTIPGNESTSDVLNTQRKISPRGTKDLRDGSGDRRTYVNPIRKHPREKPCPDSPDQDHSDDPDVDESGASIRSGDRDGDYVVPRGQENPGQQRHVSFVESPDSAPVSETSCAQ